MNKATLTSLSILLFLLFAFAALADLSLLNGVIELNESNASIMNEVFNVLVGFVFIVFSVRLKLNAIALVSSIGLTALAFWNVLVQTIHIPTYIYLSNIPKMIIYILVIILGIIVYKKLMKNESDNGILE